jgi:hypothetical protein
MLERVIHNALTLLTKTFRERLGMWRRLTAVSQLCDLQLSMRRLRCSLAHDPDE